MKNLLARLRLSLGIIFIACSSSQPANLVAGAGAVGVTVIVGTQTYSCSAVQPHTGGAPNVGGAPATGGSFPTRATGGALGTGGANATGGANSADALKRCIAAKTADTNVKNVANQSGKSVSSLASSICSDPTILGGYK